jgi:hypothetical protein
MIPDMTADDLNEHVKDVLRSAQLNWADRSKVKVRAVSGAILFMVKHNGTTTSTRVKVRTA